MMMNNLNKKTKSVIAVYGIILFVYLLAFLLIPFPKRSSSWISFAFTIISIAASLFICRIAFKDDKPLASRVYGVPVFRVGVIYAVVQFTVGLIVCIVSAFVTVPAWIPLMIGVIFLAACIIGVIATDNTRDVVEKLDKDVRETTKRVTYFRLDIDSIADSCKEPEVKDELRKLGEAFRYSDPVSSEFTADSEEKICEELEALKQLVKEGDAAAVKEKIVCVKDLLAERNRICKANKA